MKSEGAVVALVQTAIQASEKFTPTQVIIFLLVVFALVHLAMIWKAWGRQFAPPSVPPQSPTNCTRARSSKRN